MSPSHFVVILIIGWLGNQAETYSGYQNGGYWDCPSSFGWHGCNDGKFWCDCPGGGRVYYSIGCKYSFPACGVIVSGSASCSRWRNCRTCNSNGYCSSCYSGKTGSDCSSDVNECTSNPCRNGGTCANKANYYYCYCKPGWKGKQCTTNTNECLSSPCQNGGSCTDAVNGYSCKCTPGYTGFQCTQDVDECASNPCQNGGSCVNKVNKYMCLCSPGWNGTQCEIDIDECASTPCYNGASCIDSENGYTCTCAPGWEDTHCETDVDECASDPCQNEATCFDGDNNYACNCTVAFRGSSCEKANCDEKALTHTLLKTEVAKVTFVNHANTTAYVSWVTGSGGLTGCFNLPPGGNYTQGTWVGHVWIAKSGQEDGKRMELNGECEFIASNSSEQAIITSDFHEPYQAQYDR